MCVKRFDRGRPRLEARDLLLGIDFPGEQLDHVTLLPAPVMVERVSGTQAREALLQMCVVCRFAFLGLVSASTICLLYTSELPTILLV